VTGSTAQPARYVAQRAWLPQGFATNVVLEVDAGGWITGVTNADDSRGAVALRGMAIPGVPNLHCHAFQRAIAGLTERAGPAGDSFWSWRETMYQSLAGLEPDHIQAIAAQLYVELIKQGYTSVAEFHYLHNDRSGRPYPNRAELADRIIAAAKTSGIGLTLLPVLYMAAQFGGVPATDRQRRFVMETQAYLELMHALLTRYCRDPQVRIGCAPHSLRAVPLEPLRDVVEAIGIADPRAPIHMHIAEQHKEVADCVTWSGRRPLELLFAREAVDRRWCLVHCTHAAPDELKLIADSEATVGLCPSTEANLGDGIFPLRTCIELGARFGIGSDANVATSPAEELRWLEYVQRLTERRRNVTAREPGAATGARLYRQALGAGAQACGRAIGALETGYRADIVVLDPDHPALCGRDGDALLDSWIFCSAGNSVRDVMIGGEWVVRDGKHYREEAVAEAYRRTIAELALR
jgi:formimidoylglutamate deiminase